MVDMQGCLNARVAAKVLGNKEKWNLNMCKVCHVGKDWFGMTTRRKQYSTWYLFILNLNFCMLIEKRCSFSNCYHDQTIADVARKCSVKT